MCHGSNTSFSAAAANTYAKGAEVAGHTAHLLVPMDTPPWYYRWVYRMPVIHSTEQQRGGWLQKTGAMGAAL